MSLVSIRKLLFLAKQITCLGHLKVPCQRPKCHEVGPQLFPGHVQPCKVARVLSFVSLTVGTIHPLALGPWTHTRGLWQGVN